MCGREGTDHEHAPPAHTQGVFPVTTDVPERPPTDVRQAALDLMALTAGEVDLAMRVELEARAAARLAQAELEVATAKVTLANAQWDNSREALEAARVRFGVGWPDIKRVLDEAQLRLAGDLA